MVQIAFLQMDSLEGSPETNRLAVRKATQVAARAGARILALPEMWCAGYDLQRSTSLDCWEQDFAFIADLSREYEIALLGGTLLEKTEKGYYNCAIAAESGEMRARYHKQHLFKPLDEHRHLRPGEARPTVFELAGVKCAIAICYDLRFPEVFRPLAVAGVELIFVPAQWPLARIDQWRALLTARAIESQCYVLGVNRCGNFDNLCFPGDSILVDPTGGIVADGGNEPGLTHAELVTNYVTELRLTFPVLEDRRDDQYPL